MRTQTIPPIGRLLIVALSGCAQAHSPASDGTGADGGSAAVDGGYWPLDGRVDEALCTLPTGLLLCDFERDAYCTWTRCVCYPIDGRHGLCASVPYTVPTQCAHDHPCHEGHCMDVGSFRDGHVEFVGNCTPEALCRALLAIGDPAYCFYADGSVYETGVLARDECDADDRSIVCGAGCGGCEAGELCLGPSELHGLGICAEAAGTRYCGAGFTRPCADDEGCARLRLAGGNVAPYEVLAGVCIPAERCTRAATRYPERFVCER